MKLVKDRKSFTLIETLVVVGVIGLIIPALFSIFYIVIRQQVKLYRLAEVKRQGDSVRNTFQTIITNHAYRIYDSLGTELCTTAGSSAGNISYFEDQYGNSITVAKSGTVLRIDVANNPPPVPQIPLSSGNLASSKVNFITSADYMSCFKNSLYSPPFIIFNYDVEYITSSTRVEDIAVLNYIYAVKLRNYPSPY